MPANDGMPCVWSRRSLLAALMAGSVTMLTGCWVRLEKDAPRNLDLPTRVPMPEEQELLRAHRDAVRLRELAGGLGTSSTQLTQLLATVHGLQASVFESLLRSGGVPRAEITATPTATTTASPSPPPSASASASDSTSASASKPTATVADAAPAPVPVPTGINELIGAEAQGLSAQALSDLARISRDQVPLLGSMTAQRAAAVLLLGGRLPSAGTLGPGGSTPNGPVGEPAAAQLEAIRSAVYGFEVVAAQTDASHRVAAAKTLAALRAASSELQRLAGSAAKPIPLGYALPFPVATPAAALKLATHLMTALREAIASQLPAVTGDASGLTGTVQVLADVSVQAVAWRVPLTAFPGLTDT